MPVVEVARHLYRFFPALEGRTIRVEAGTAAEVVRAMDDLAPGFSGYIMDERGALRRHVNLFIDGKMVVDREKLSDRIGPDATVHIFQALSGG